MEREQDLLIQDSLRRSYRVHVWEGSFWRFDLFHGPSRVGWANCSFEPPVLRLDDLHIADNAFHPAGRFVRLVRRLLNRPQRPVSYRGRGLGGALLRLIAALAQEQGFAYIEGSLSWHDLEANPNLPEWYRQRGFIVTAGGAYGSGQIRLQLAPRNSGKDA